MEVYKLLIVEDEKSIAYGIANSIEWEAWGFVISGVCGNGIEALEQIKKEKPHVVLSDIRMPEMDGMELMQYLSQHYPEIKIIILSGYNDFEYLQMSIKNRVMEYLLKPTDLDEFEVTFRKIKERLDEEQKLTLAYEESKDLKRRRKYNALLKGYGYQEEETEEEFFLQKEQWYGVILIHLDIPGTENKNTFYQAQMQVEKILNKRTSKAGIEGTYIWNFEEKITGILTAREEPLKEELYSYVRKLAEGILEESGILIYAGVSNFYTDFQMLPQCYEQAKCCASQKIYSDGKNLVMFYQEIQEADFDYYAVSFDMGRILKEIMGQEENRADDILDEIFSEFRGKVILDYHYMDHLSLELLFNLSRALLDYGIRLEKVMKRLDCTYTDLYSIKTLTEKKEFLSRILREVSKEMAGTKGEWNSQNNLAQKIKEIVDEEYDSNQISLEYVGAKVHKNSAYISKIFKNEFGCNFSDYIITKRLEKSRMLLKDPARKIYEISQEMGWADVSNYIKLFKKKYGISPKEYRNIPKPEGESAEKPNEDE